MSEFLQAVTQAFSSDGVLARAAPGFLPRSGQTEMALAVAQCIETGGDLVVEAGTGVGKTYAYLVPALLSGERILLSTATKTLQDQLFGRDLPRLLAALGQTARLALLKGRSSYYCIERAEIAPHMLQAGERHVAATLTRIAQWARQTQTGDLAEVPGLDERSPALPLVTSTKDNCLGSDCPKFKACFVNQARREALAADLVVINHHLFFADMAVRESGMAELLPSCRVVIFDEAHKLNEIGVEFSGFQLGSRQLLEFCRDTLAAGLAKARGFAPWNDLVYDLEQATRALRMVFLDAGIGNGRVGWAQAAPDGLPLPVWELALEAVIQALAPLLAALEVCGPSAPELARLLVRGRELLAGADQFTGGCANDHVRWVEVGAQLRLTEAPLDIAALLRSQHTNALPAASVEEDGFSDEAQAAPPWGSEHPDDDDSGGENAQWVGPGKSWIYTSATLGDDAALSWFTKPCGLESARILTVKSPFDYAAQAGIYIPAKFPKPADPGHSVEVARLAARAALQLGGRTMVLTTTLRALTTIGDTLEQLFAEQCQLQVLRQGVSTKRELIERFRAAGLEGRPGCVLVASASFWEGVDIPGDALQLVLIDKLPFPPPHDPLVKARGKRLEEAGRSAFSDYFIPEAIVALKQGAGRLIRHENDLGVLVICDTRLQSMGYGRRVLAALPPMQRITDDAVLMDQLALITKIATNS